MSESVFLVAFAIAAATTLMVVKTIAEAFTGRPPSPAELAQIQEQSDRQAAMVDEAQATAATQSAQLAELQERLDFTERQLTQARDRPSLRPGDAVG